MVCTTYRRGSAHFVCAMRVRHRECRNINVRPEVINRPVDGPVGGHAYQEGEQRDGGVSEKASHAAIIHLIVGQDQELMGKRALLGKATGVGFAQRKVFAQQKPSLPNGSPAT